MMLSKVLTRPRTGRVLTVGGVLVFFAFGVTGCGGATSSVASASDSESAVSVRPAASVNAVSDRYETTLERRNGRLRIRPVPVSYRPTISKAEALEVFKSKQLFPEIAEREAPDVRLGRYTSDQLSVTSPAVHLDRPVWVIRYDNVPPEPSSPAPPSIGPGQDAPTNTAVDILVFIDADTGQFLNAVQDPAVVR
jgi:hypothetical protein